jgi:hypothetical protein
LPYWNGEAEPSAASAGDGPLDSVRVVQDRPFTQNLFIRKMEGPHTSAEDAGQRRRRTQ